jgi:hypothetical protein
MMSIEKIKKVHGFYIHKNWHCTLPFEKLSIEGEPSTILMSEPRINTLAEKFDLKNCRILELGCLEGVHTFMLQMLGAKKVIAIEGRAENFLKCLVIKNAFNLDRCQFLYGDINQSISLLQGPFELCLAVGILYHLKDPLSIIHRVAELAQSLFVWTHYATKDFPPGQLKEISCQGNSYTGKYVKEDTRHYLSGLDAISFWMLQDDIIKAVQDAGFRQIDFIEKEDHENGPAITFLARK